jgi:hypothetical protein
MPWRMPEFLGDSKEHHLFVGIVCHPMSSAPGRFADGVVRFDQEMS